MGAWNIPYDAPESKAKRLVYSSKIEDLYPDTLYEFSISYFDYGKWMNLTSPTRLFRTFPDDPESNRNFTVVFGGDIGNLDSAIEMHKTVAKHNPYAAFVGGDLAYDAGFVQ